MQLLCKYCQREWQYVIERGVCVYCGKFNDPCLRKVTSIPRLNNATPEEWDAASRAALSDSKAQPAPVSNNGPAVWGLVINDMAGRDNFGKQKYGTQLQPNNGRDFLMDAYQEALDLAVYLRGAIYERDNK